MKHSWALITPLVTIFNQYFVLVALNGLGGNAKEKAII